MNVCAGEKIAKFSNNFLSYEVFLWDVEEVKLLIVTYSSY